MKKIKKIAASILAVAAMITSFTSLTASAYINEYSTNSQKAENSSKTIDSVIYAKNKHSSYSDFYGHVKYYNNSTNAWLGSKDSLCSNVPRNFQGSIMFSWTYSSNLPAVTRVEASCDAYLVYHTYASPYETFSASDGTSYVYN